MCQIFTLSLLSLICLSSAVDKDKIQHQISPNSTELTLQELMNDTSNLNPDDAVELVFLPGNHSLSSEVRLSHISELNILGSDSSTVIMCSNNGTFEFSNISLLQVKYLQFHGCEGIIVASIISVAIEYSSFICQTISRAMLNLSGLNAFIKDCGFEAASDESEGENLIMITASASNICLTNCVLTMQHGGALLAENESKVNIINATFCDSIANQIGDHSALVKFISSDIEMEGCTVKNNKGSLLMSMRNYAQVAIIDSSFVNNTAMECTLCVSYSNVSLQQTIISDNTGNFSVLYLVSSRINVTDGLSYSQNSGSFLVRNSIMTINGTNKFERNVQMGMSTSADSYHAKGTLTIIQSTTIFHGTTYLVDNESEKSGGGLYVSDSDIKLYGNLMIARNVANNGGGAFFYLTYLVCCGNLSFADNEAHNIGGGIYAISTVIVLTNSHEAVTSTSCEHSGFLSISNNKAWIGGGMYLAVNSKLHGVESRTFNYMVDFTSNNATKEGGAIFVNDSTYPGVCASTSFATYDVQTECFFQAMHDDEDTGTYQQYHHLSFVDNSAQTGTILYGGLLDRCTVNPQATVYNKVFHSINHVDPIYAISYFQHESGHGMNLTDTVTEGIASDALRICFCQRNKPLNCDYKPPAFNAVKGKEFRIAIAVVDQVNQSRYQSFTIASDIHGNKGTLENGKHIITQNRAECTPLNLMIRSSDESVELDLYIENSPCRGAGLSVSTVTVKFDQCICPIGFQDKNSGDDCECKCHDRIKQYVETCISENQTIQKKHNSWIGYFNDSDINGYIVYPNCPYDFCLPPTDGAINLNTPQDNDIQCNYNRSGLLCGGCKQGFQLSMGSPRCIKCSESLIGIYIMGVLVGGVGGIVMVGVLLVLNLTVAQGTSNGLIFYANILRMSRSAFFPSIKPSFFTVFIYLLNTQLGLDRCVPGDIDQYKKMWKRLIFPLYMLSLVAAIILLSKYSSKCARMIGKRNPVATLATLILLTYAELLQVVIDVFSFATLEYPSGSHELVWRPDARVKYLKGKHIALFLVAVVIVAIGIVYTCLLFNWQWLTRAPNKYIFRWIRNTKLSSFMDAYHAPYKPKYRYWTGLLLFVRIMLNVGMIANKSGDPQYNLLTIVILAALLIVLKAYLADNIYKQSLLDYLEITCYLNLLLLSLIILTFASVGNPDSHVTEVSVNISVSVIFLMALCVLLYHIHTTLCDIKAYKCWSERIMHWRKWSTNSLYSEKNIAVDYERSTTEISLSDLIKGSNDQKQCTTRNNIKENSCTTGQYADSSNLREPLLEEY